MTGAVGAVYCGGVVVWWTWQSENGRSYLISLVSNFSWLLLRRRCCGCGCCWWMNYGGKRLRWMGSMCRPSCSTWLGISCVLEDC